MDTNDIIELLDVLYGMITEAWSVPLGNDKCIIEREKAVEIINEIKANLPTALAESKRLVSARDEFIGNAKREAEALRKSAEESARNMIEEQTVVRAAKARSSEIISAAETKSNELRKIASSYVDDLMKRAEQTLAQSLKTIQDAQAAFTSSAITTSNSMSQEKQQQQGQAKVQQTVQNRTQVQQTAERNAVQNRGPENYQDRDQQNQQRKQTRQQPVTE